jgi:putative ABC transport system permease protein
MFNREEQDRELDAELRAWAEQLTEENIRAGMPAEEARRVALAETGGFEQVKERVRDERRGALLETVVRDAAYALRSLRRSRGFAAVAILTLALGIGATTAIFSAVHAVLLRPLPYAAADRLMMLWLNNTREQIQRDVTSYPNFLDWREAPAFDGVAGYSATTGSFTGDNDAEEYAGAWVTGDFFGVLQSRPHVGTRLGDEHTRPGNEQVVVLSHGLWTRRYGEAPDIVGRVVQINGVGREVIGVMPRGFAYPDGADFWMPIAPETEAWQQPTAARGSLWLSVIGRLRPDASIERADAELAGIMARIAEEFPQTAGNGVFIEPLRDTIVGHVRPGLLILLGAVAFVLLIACVNVANLLLARGAARRRELAVRSALGASGRRLATQALVESLVLSGLGGVAGLLVALAGTALLVGASPADLPRLDGVRVDRVVVGFALLVTLVTGLGFGLAPALQARAAGLATTLREAGRGSSSRGLARTRRLLVTAEIALALMLLVGAGLLVRSFAALQSVEPGFETERVLSFRVNMGSTRYPEPSHVRQFQTDLLERLNALPGVAAATGITTLFLSRLPNMSPIALEGAPAPADADPIVSVTSDFVHPSFFAAMRIPLVHGRGFETSDVAGATPVVIVNETFVRRFLPGEDPIGRRFTRGNPQDTAAVWQTIVGVVADSRRSGLNEPVRPEAYRPTTQVAPRSLEVLVRAGGPPLALVPAVRGLLRELDADMAVSQVRTVEGALAEAIAARRFVMLLLGAFAALAITLAAIGIYGVLAYLLGQRTRELGIRMALGADRDAVLALVFRQSMRHVLPGLAVGTAGALAFTRLLRSQLFGVEPTDPTTFAAVILLLGGVALLATWVPARRALRVNPQEALRHD